ncbi:hypothetical protein [Hydrogenibacillus sp. N12]|uniref:Kae1-like domain-containing protein n=1 Tax=Hydrogenibacillus sp. N12 TaxID=2866627 RepID=UPI00207BE141|nr:hypothetical protein [Hydrogenibacillus sp. N12]
MRCRAPGSGVPLAEGDDPPGPAVCAAVCGAPSGGGAWARPRRRPEKRGHPRGRRAGLLSEHLGDLETDEAQVAFEAAVEALLSMGGVSKTEPIVAFDRHPDYRPAQFAETLPARRRVPVQRHRAYIAGVLAEREAPEARVVGVAFDGTGDGDDGAIWGGEFFVGSLTAGFRRAGHLRAARLPGGDAAARFPLQALAGFVFEAPDVVQRLARRRALPTRFWQALKFAEGNEQTVPATSAGRLFDAVAVLLGFDRAIPFEGQATIRLEHPAARARSGKRRSSERYPFEPRYPFPWRDGELDYRPLLAAMVDDLVSGRPAAEIALAFHRSVAGTIAEAAAELFRREKAEAVVVAGGVFQNAVLLEALKAALEAHGVPLWVPRAVPPNDGGLSLGQAALAVTGGGAIRS